jgi:ribonuclease PH
VLLDLEYQEDSRAEVDMNVVMTADGGLVETQATAEKGTYSRKQLDEMLDVAEAGIRELLAAQRQVIGS